MNYNYKILILKGWRDLKEKKFLDRYFYKEFKKAERDLFIKADEFFEGCFHWIKQFEAVIAEDLGNNEPINERYVNFSRDSSLSGLYGFKLYFDDITSIKEALQAAYNILLEELRNETLSELNKQPEQPSLPEKEVIDLKSQIEQKLWFMQKADPRRHGTILNETDFNRLIEWVTYFFNNDFTLPEINNPIITVNTAKGNVIYSFILLFDELHPTATRPDSLFGLIIKCFHEYREDEIVNLKKSTSKPQYYDILTKR